MTRDPLNTARRNLDEFHRAGLFIGKVCDLAKEVTPFQLLTSTLRLSIGWSTGHDLRIRLQCGQRLDAIFARNWKRFGARPETTRQLLKVGLPVALQIA